MAAVYLLKRCWASALTTPVLAVLIVALGISKASATDVSQCDAALVQDRDNSVFKNSVDYRLATLVTESEWRKASQNAGAEATIYGVPFSASWSDYKENTRQTLDARNESFKIDEVRQYAISGLSQNGRIAYETCIKGLTGAAGVNLSLGKVTDSQATVFVSYRPGPGGATSTKLAWSGMKAAKKSKFPSRISYSSTNVVIVDRPKSGNAILNVSGGGTVDQVEIFPPLSEPKPSPSYVLNVDGIDDVFQCFINGGTTPVTNVVFGQQDLNRDITGSLKPGKNLLACSIRDINKAYGKYHCWGYRYWIVRNKESTPLLDRRGGVAAPMGRQMRRSSSLRYFISECHRAEVV